MDHEHWLALARVPGIGPRSFRRLLERYGSPRRLFEHPELAAELPAELRASLRSPDWDGVSRDLAWAEAQGNRILLWHHAEYPPLLRQLPDPPMLLFVRGDAGLLGSPQLAIVGSRNPTTGGAETAQAFAHHLAGSGITVTSGMALGIDGAAHRGALAAGGHTIAVAGTGLDRVYPARHRQLAHQISEHGALVSEFPPGTPALPEHFPRRNRVISGLSLGTLVVEAALRSGSLITARLAAEQSREVFAIPGSIHNPLARGCHALIRQGAKLVETAADVLEELLPQLHLALEERPAPAETTGTRSGDAARREVLDCLGYDPVSVDLLVERTGLTPEGVSSILLELELEGQVTSAAGGLYTRA